MKIIAAIACIALATTPAVAQRTVQPGHPIPVVPQTGRLLEGKPLLNPDGTTPRPLTNPNGTPPRTIHVYPFVTPYYGTVGKIIVHPARFNLPYPPYGYVWQRIYNDAALTDLRYGSIVELRTGWFR